LALAAASTTRIRLAIGSQVKAHITRRYTDGRPGRGTARPAGEEVRARFGGLVDRLQVGVNGDTAEFAELFDALRASNGSLPSAVQSHHASVRKFLFSA
jgi:hypothetical protein